MPHTNVALLDVIQATWINMLPSVEYRLHLTTRKSQQIKIEKKKEFPFYRKSFHRAIVMDRVGLKFSDKKETKQLRICNKHKFKDLKKKDYICSKW